MKKNRSGRVLLVTLFLVVAGTGAAFWADLRPSFGSEEAESTQGQAARRGPLRISVIEKGNLKAANSVDIKSEVEGRSTILFLIEEGSEVKKGDLLAELDTSDLVERGVSQEITVQNAEAAFEKAKQNFEIQKSTNSSDLDRAQRELEFAQIDLKKYEEGEFNQQEKKHDEDITLAKEELARAEQELDFSEKLHGKGFLERTQLEADRLSKQRSEIQLAQKERAQELFLEYEHPRKLIELKATLTEKERELERVKLRSAARVADYEADKRTSKTRLDLEREKLAKLQAQIEKARMTAPIDGMVVYAQENRWGGEPIQEGTQVYERQLIMTIPSSEGMVAEASLHESVLEKVEVGLPCIMTVDALPDRTFEGKVKFKSVLPDQTSWWRNPDLRVYRCEIEVVGNDPRLRPGMSASIEIVVDDIQDTTYVPVQAVFLDGGEPICFVSHQAEVQKRTVEVGQNNGKWVEILEGIDEGEVVLLSQPAGFALAPLEEGGDSKGIESVDESDEPAAGASPALSAVHAEGS